MLKVLFMEIKPIVEYPGYSAREDGIILDCNGKVLWKSLTSGGYHTVFINGKSVHVHELILSTFKPLTNRKNMVPNHFDLNKLNNALSNLDWVDDSWNNIHAELMYRRNPNRPHIKVIGDEKILFNTIDDCSEYFNKQTLEIWNVLRYNLEIDGKRLVYLKWNDKDVLKVVREKTLKRVSKTKVRNIKIMDLTNGVVKHYESMLSAARSLGVLLTHIRNRLSTAESPKVLNKRYVISDADGNFDYLTDNLKKELMSRGGKLVIAFNKSNNEFKTYKSAYSFIKTEGLKGFKKSITTNLKNKRLKEVNQFLFCYVPIEYEDNPDLYLIMKMGGLI